MALFIRLTQKLQMDIWMEECKRRKELGLAEIYLYEKDTKAVSYQVRLDVFPSVLWL